MFKKLTLFSVVLALTVVVLGTYSRFSGGHLSCPEWPTCYGQLFIGDISQLNMPSEVDLLDIWKELAYRYAYALLGLVFLPMAILSWREKTYRFFAVASMLALLLNYGLQAILNYWLVRSHAMPIVVMGSIILGLVSFWLLYRLYLRGKAKLNLLIKPSSVWFCRIVMLVLFLQISLGAWISANHASLICVGFPQCNGQWLPTADYKNALNLLGGLLKCYSGDLSYDQQVAINVLHRWGALACFMLITVFIWVSLSANKPKPVKASALWLSLLVFVEISLGIAGYKFEMPIWVVIAHNAVAALLMLPLLTISFYSRYGFIEHESALTKPEPAVVSIAADIADAIYEVPASESLLMRLKSQLKRTRSGLGGILSNLTLGSKAIDKDLLEELETRLLMADIGITVTTDIITQLTQRLERQQLSDGAALSAALKEDLLTILQPCNQPLSIPEQDKPYVILVVGVNGAGKTTTIGKLAKRLQVQGYSVMLAAGDTFRAAAVEQLQTWGERNNIHVVAQHTGADSASVIFDGVQSAQAKGIDVLIADTAGRLHTKSNLMDELKKIKRIMAKLDDTAPHEVLLVLDAGTGQNALSQAKIFNEAVALTGLVLTKLDGTAKGGVIFALAKQSGIPIRFIGIGEGIDDLQDFNAENFVDALFAND